MVELIDQAVAGKSIEWMAIAHVAVLGAVVEFEAWLRSNLVCPDDILIVE